MARVLAIAVAAFFLMGISANAAGWTVTHFSGEVAISGHEGGLIPVALSTELPAGATVTTGERGRVLLTRGKETMTIGSGTVVSIPADSLTGFTTINQQVGEILFDVEKRNVKHFAVETPFLAAVVKGTRFTVTVSSNGAGVSVERGRVGVTDIASRRHVDVVRGQVAKVTFSNFSSGPSVSTAPTSAWPENPPGRARPRASNEDPFSALSRSVAKWMKGSAEPGRGKHSKHSVSRGQGGGQFWKHWNFNGGQGADAGNHGHSKGGKSKGWFSEGDSRSVGERGRSDRHHRGGGREGDHGGHSGGNGKHHGGGHHDD